MLKLMTLEIRKFKLGGLFKAVLIANLVILAFMIMVIFIDQGEIDPTFATFSEVFDGLSVFVKTTFIIFASVLLSKLVIEEYRSNTISLLFMYPIPRKSLMTAKLIIVFLFTLVNIIVSNIVLGAIIVGINHFVEVIPGTISLQDAGTELVTIMADAVYAAGISLIALFVGMRKKSVSATIVTAVLVASLISSGWGDFRLGNLVGVSVSLGLVGMVIAYLSIRNVESEDIA
ncbi:ABC transporter permease [Paenibacillus donghaensis]|uniref:ABC transporter permease n=1 Tax=Paenibacillus donghaensis TaxID=414771 RepID=A0A2Z2KJV6_9BACL|nr:ABC transporter permease [Paenibacillus donghaensis]